MPRAITLFVSLVLLLGLTSGAQAIIYNYTFTGSDSYGTASATMVLNVRGGLGCLDRKQGFISGKLLRV
jgi:hypothetical protein